MERENYFPMHDFIKSSFNSVAEEEHQQPIAQIPTGNI